MALTEASIAVGWCDRSFVLAWWHFNGSVPAMPITRAVFLIFKCEKNIYLHFFFSFLPTAKSEHHQCRQDAIWSNPSSTHLPASFRNTGSDFLLSTVVKESVGGRICSIFYLGTHTIYLELCQLRSVLTLLVNAFSCSHQIDWKESLFSQEWKDENTCFKSDRSTDSLSHTILA